MVVLRPVRLVFAEADHPMDVLPAPLTVVIESQRGRGVADAPRCAAGGDNRLAVPERGGRRHALPGRYKVNVVPGGGVSGSKTVTLY